MTNDAIDARLAVIEHQIAELVERFGKVEEVVTNLRLHEARMEWLERVMWVAIGCVVPIAISIAAAAVRFGATAASAK